VANLIHVVLDSLLGANAPSGLAGNIFDGAAAGRIHGPVFAEDAVLDLTVCVIHLALANMCHDSVWILIGDVVVVEEVGLVLTMGASAVCDSCDGSDVVHGPANFIDGVDALLDQSSSAEPLVVLPVAHLEFHVAHAIRLLDAISERGHWVEHIGPVNGNDATQFTGEDFFVSLFGAGVEAPAEAVLDRGALLLGHLSGLDDGFDARHVDGHGFLDESVFASFDSGTQVLRTEVWRGAEKNDVNTGSNDPFVSIEADELALLGSLHTFVVAGADPNGVLDSAFESITDGPKNDIWVGIHGLCEGAASATTAADDADFNLIRRVLCLQDVGDGGGK